jgi:hypothetical protein
MKTLRNAVPLVALAALAAAGCFLVSGQFVVNYALPTPLTFNSTGVFAGADVNLNTIGDYNDHKSDLKRVDDLALIGDFRNLDVSSVTIEAWIVPSAALNLTPTTLPTTPGAQKLWGPLTIAASSTVNVDWNKSASLFVGRQALIDEIKGDGHFSLYVKGTTSTFDVQLSKGAVIAVVAAAK